MRSVSSRAKEYIERGHWPGVTVAQSLARSVESYPHKVAVVQGEERISYSALWARAHRLGSALLHLGIRRGDIVAVQLPNWVEFLYVHYALASIGAITLPIIPSYRKREVSHILAFSQAVGYVAPSRFGGFDYTSMVEQLQPYPPHLRHIFVIGDRLPPGGISLGELWANEIKGGYPATGNERRAAEATDVVCLMMTGGTTGTPKGVPRTHNELLAHAAAWATVMGITEESTMLVPVQITHVFGLVEGVYIPLISGGRVILVDRPDPNRILRLIEKERVTVALLIPALLSALVNLPSLSQYDTTSLELIVTGGGTCPPGLIEQVRDSLRCQVISQYGMSEGPLSTTTRDDPPEVSSQTVGSPHCAGAEYKVVDEDRQELPPGRIGELAFRGPTLFEGYYQNAAATQESFDQEGWFYTGDLCFQDEKGNLHVVGRQKDLIRRGAETIIPKEIEELLHAHPKILHAAVIGMPDRRWGERVCAYVVPRTGEKITLAELNRFLQEKQIASFKLLERLEMVEELPLTPPSKVKKSVLREDIAQKLRAEGKI